MGNPFTHNIYKGKGAAIDDDNLVEGYYTLSNSGAWEVNASSENPIKPCQSILIKTMKSGEIVINKTNRNPSKRSNDDEMLVVNVSNKDYEDKAYVSFGKSHGLEKINHQNEKIPMVYFPVDAVNYAIAVLKSDVKEIPLSFVAKTMGEYTITIDSDNKMFESVNLVDNVTGNVTDMLTGSYTFVATSNDAPNRFVIRFKGNSLDENSDNDEPFVSVNNGRLIINNISDKAVVDIYDIMGRKVLGGIVDVTDGSNIVDVNDVQTGLYIIKVSDKKGIRVQKIIL